MRALFLIHGKKILKKCKREKRIFSNYKVKYNNIIFWLQFKTFTSLFGERVRIDPATTVLISAIA